MTLRSEEPRWPSSSTIPSPWFPQRWPRPRSATKASPVTSSALPRAGLAQTRCTKEGGSKGITLRCGGRTTKPKRPFGRFLRNRRVPKRVLPRRGKKALLLSLVSIYTVPIFRHPDCSLVCRAGFFREKLKARISWALAGLSVIRDKQGVRTSLF